MMKFCTRHDFKLPALFGLIKAKFCSEVILMVPPALSEGSSMGILINRRWLTDTVQLKSCKFGEKDRNVV